MTALFDPDQTFWRGVYIIRIEPNGKKVIINKKRLKTYSTFAWRTGLFPCSTWAKTASLVTLASISSKPSVEAQHFVLNGKVWSVAALELIVTRT